MLMKVYVAGDPEMAEVSAALHKLVLEATIYHSERDQTQGLIDVRGHWSLNRMKEWFQSSQTFRAGSLLYYAEV